MQSTFTNAQRERLFRNRPANVGMGLALADWHRVVQFIESAQKPNAQVQVSTDEERDMLRAERDRLHALINNPQTAEFLSAVAAEKAHQIERWGAAHDRSKSAEHWFWLVGYLAGKALRAAITGNREKALHHTISSAAALACWHEAITADASGTGVGRDTDLRKHDEPTAGE